MESQNNELELFLSNLEQRNPTKNMMIWMKYYDEVCERICCHSTDCGSIRCSGCYVYMSGCPPLSRYQCIDCEILPPETLYNPRPEICEKCYFNPKILHNHYKWLRVDEKGHHSITKRLVGVSPLKELTISDFPIVNTLEGTSCNICGDQFNEENPSVSYPGCTKQHGSSMKDKLLGCRDSKEYSHAQCLMAWYEASKRNSYCGKLLYCEICIHESDLENWKYQFLEVKELVKNFNENKNNLVELIQKKLAITIDSQEFNSEFELSNLCVLKLLALHPQPWIQKIIKEVFN